MNMDLRGVAYDGIGGGSGDPSDSTGGSSSKISRC